MQFNLADLYESVADAIPDREALVCGERRLTFRQLDERATRLAHSPCGAGDQAGRPHRALPVQRHGVHRGERWRRTRSAPCRSTSTTATSRTSSSTCSTTPTSSRSSTTASSRRGSPRSRRRCRNCRRSSPSTTAAALTTKRSALPTTRRRSRKHRRSANFAPRSGRRRLHPLHRRHDGHAQGRDVAARGPVLLGADGRRTPTARRRETPEQVAQSAASKGVMTALPAAPLMHGAAQWAALINLYGGGKTVLAKGKSFDPHQVWRLVQDERREHDRHRRRRDGAAAGGGARGAGRDVRPLVPAGAGQRRRDVLRAREGAAQAAPAER